MALLVIVWRTLSMMRQGLIWAAPVLFHSKRNPYLRPCVVVYDLRFLNPMGLSNGPQMKSSIRQDQTLKITCGTIFLIQLTVNFETEVFLDVTAPFCLQFFETWKRIWEYCFTVKAPVYRRQPTVSSKFTEIVSHGVDTNVGDKKVCSSSQNFKERSGLCFCPLIEKTLLIYHYAWYDLYLEFRADKVWNDYIRKCQSLSDTTSPTQTRCNADITYSRGTSMDFKEPRTSSSSNPSLTLGNLKKLLHKLQ